MRAHQVVGDEVADALVELGRAFEIGEQEGQAGDLQALVDVERVGPVDVAERLVGEQALGGQERPALAEQVVELVPRDPHAGQHPRVGAVLERDSQRPRAHRKGRVRRAHFVEDDGEILALARRFALDVEELRPARHRVHDDDEFSRQLQ